MAEMPTVVMSAKITATRLAYGRIQLSHVGELTHSNVTNVSSMLTVTTTETVYAMMTGMEKLIAVSITDNALRNVSAALAHTTPIVSSVRVTHPLETMAVHVMKDGPEMTVKTGKVSVHVNVSAVTPKTTVKEAVLNTLIGA